MGTVYGQIAFCGSETDKGRCTASLSRNAPAQADPQLDTPSAWIAGRGGSAAPGAIGLQVVLDGTLFAQSDLARALDVPPGLPAAALLARAWERWGEDAPRRLNGDYAAILHRGGMAVLLCDHIGTRPLYWHWENGRLSFATLIPDLLALLPAAPDADEQAIAAFLRWPTALGPHTLLRGIKAVEPGHALIVTTEGPRALRWWRPEDAPPIRLATANDYGAALRALAETAVADRLPATGSIAAHLSGGFDSTAVALLAAETLRAQGRDLIATYGWSPGISDDAPAMPGDDERPRITAIAEAAGLTHRFCGITGHRMLDFLAHPIETEGLADVADEFPVLERAKADGVTTILSGWGGDEAFSAHAHGVPAWMLASGRLGPLLTLARGRGGFRNPRAMAGFLWRAAAVPLLPDALFNRLGPFDELYKNGCYLSPRLAALPPLAGLPKSTRLTANPATDIRNALNQRHLGERMATWAAWGAPYGIEYRYPLTDRRILEFILGVPPDMLWADRYPRYFARATLRGRLRGRLGKSDPANERRRLESLRFTWRALAEQAAAGALDGPCDWLDMPALRRDILRGPSGEDTPDIKTFIRIMPAMRIWHMAQRMGAAAPLRLSA